MILAGKAWWTPKRMNYCFVFWRVSSEPSTSSRKRSQGPYFPGSCRLLSSPPLCDTCWGDGTTGPVVHVAWVESMLPVVDCHRFGSHFWETATLEASPTEKQRPQKSLGPGRWTLICPVAVRASWKLSEGTSPPVLVTTRASRSRAVPCRVTTAIPSPSSQQKRHPLGGTGKWLGWIDLNRWIQLICSYYTFKTWSCQAGEVKMYDVLTCVLYRLWSSASDSF